MQIGIIGDTHGSTESMAKINDVFPPVEFYIHTGDHWQDAVYFEKKWRVPVLTVKGNCDCGEYPSELLFTAGGKKFFVTHGHRYGVKFSLHRLFYRALEEGADYCIYGHTHILRYEEMEGIWFLNPGSPICPRGLKKCSGILLQENQGRWQWELRGG